jgi:exonuclease 1
MKTVASDQGKTTGKTTDTIDGPPDLGLLAYTSTVCCPERSKHAGNPPDLSTFAYKPVKAAVGRLNGSRFRETAPKATGGTSRSQFK